MEWRPLNSLSLEGFEGRGVLVGLPGGVGYYGKVKAVRAMCVVLENNGFSQNIFFDKPWQYVIVDPPRHLNPKLADRRLPLENPNG